MPQPPSSALVAVQDELDALRSIASEASLDTLRDGSWLVPLLREATADYMRDVQLDALIAEHPGLTDDTLADARIHDAQWRGALAGGMSAGAYSTVVLASLATGVFVGAAIPAAVTAFAVDLYYQARLQICLAWDLSLIYGHPLDPADDGDLWKLCRVAFGVDEASPLTDLAAPTLPLASRFGTRALTTAARLATGIQAIGRTLAMRSLAKLAIPAMGVPLCAGVNYMTVGAVGRAARQIFRDRAAGKALAAELENAEALVTCAVVLMLHEDGRLERAEVAMLAQLADGSAAVEVALALGRDGLLWRIEGAPAELRGAAVEAARAAAAVDGEATEAERGLLTRLEQLSLLD